MLKIGKKSEYARVPLGGGAWIMCRPATSVDREAGQIAARLFFEKAREGAAALADYGFDIRGFEQLSGDVELSVGVSSVVNLVEVGMRCISEWHGVGDEDGKPLEFNRKNLALLLADTTLFTIVENKLYERLSTVAKEGNGSAPSPSGAPAGASTTAETAGA